MKSVRQALVIAMVFFVSSVLISRPSYGNYETKIYAVTTWDDDCPGDTVPWWDDYCDEWYDTVTDRASWDRSGRQVNGNVRDGKFCDEDRVAWGEDDVYLDDADAAMVCLHGQDYFGRWRGYMRVDPEGGENCKAWQYHMDFGDDDLEFLFLSSCNSADDNYLVGTPNWYDSFEGIHQIGGYHGFMHIGSDGVQNYEDFANDSFYDGVATAWVLNMHHYWGDPNWVWDCPVAIVEGNSSHDAADRADNELMQMKAPYSDPTGDDFVWKAYDLCDPDGEDAFDP